MRRSYNPVIDGSHEGEPNPYKSMYSQAFGVGKSEKKERRDKKTNLVVQDTKNLLHRDSVQGPSTLKTRFMTPQKDTPGLKKNLLMSNKEAQRRENQEQNEKK